MVKNDEREILLGFQMMAKPPDSPSTSTIVTLQPLQHLVAIFSIVMDVHLVSSNNTVEGFSSDIKVFKHLCLIRLLMPLTFHEMYFIGKVGV